MAKYHKCLKYHDDETEKHEITEEERAFLKELQKEINTQDHVSQADPRFWVIKGTERLYNVDDADGYELYDKEDCESVASDIPGICEYIKNNLLDEINKESGLEFTLEIKEGVFERDSILVTWNDDGEIETEELEDMDEINTWLEERGCDEYDVISYKIIPRIYENVMFLTQIDAENHLKSNDYHYSDDAHTYAMTAWRSPRVEKLVNILQTVDW